MNNSNKGGMGWKHKTGGSTPRQRAKVEKVMREFKEGKLHSGSKKGLVVKDRDQAIAIALSEAGMSKKMAQGGGVDSPIYEIDNTKYYSYDFINKGNRWRILIAWGKYNYLSITKKTNNPFGGVLGKEFDTIDEALNHYKDMNIKSNILFAANSAKEYGYEPKYADGGGLSTFNTRSFTLDELKDYLWKNEIWISYFKKGQTGITPASETKIIWDGTSNASALKEWKNKKLTISDYGQLEVDKGYENMYMTLVVYELDGSDDPYEIRIYSKDNHAELRKFANYLIEKFKTGGSTYAGGGNIKEGERISFTDVHGKFGLGYYHLDSNGKVQVLDYKLDPIEVKLDSIKSEKLKHDSELWNRTFQGTGIEYHVPFTFDQFLKMMRQNRNNWKTSLYSGKHQIFDERNYGVLMGYFDAYNNMLYIISEKGEQGRIDRSKGIEPLTKWLKDNMGIDYRNYRNKNFNPKGEYYARGGKVSESDITPGTKFKAKSGIVFIVDEIKDGMVHSSLEGGEKGNYRDPIGDFVDFMNEMEAKRVMSSKKKSTTKSGSMYVELKSVGNVDFGDSSERAKNIALKKVNVESIEEAKSVVRKFISDNDLGGGNWIGGKVFENGKNIGYIAYNGNYFEGERKMAKGGFVVKYDPDGKQALVRTMSEAKSFVKVLEQHGHTNIQILPFNKPKMAQGGGIPEYVPVSEKQNKAEVDRFIEYVNMFYGKGADAMGKDGYTKAQIKTAVVKYLNDLNKEYTWGYGDSLDRERVYSYLMNPKQEGINNPSFAQGGGVDEKMYIVTDGKDKGIIISAKDADEAIKIGNKKFYSPYSITERLNTVQLYEQGKHLFTSAKGNATFDKVQFHFSGKDGSGVQTSYDTSIDTKPNANQKEFIGESNIDYIKFFNDKKSKNGSTGWKHKSK